jgi:hypothetical protein
MRTTIRRTSLSMLVLCICTACASAGGGAGQPGTRVEQDARIVQMTDERNRDVVFYQLRDSVAEPPRPGLFRIPDGETGIRPSYEMAWWRFR